MDKFVPISPEGEAMATQVVDAAFRVHSGLGPGLLEATYVACLVYELKKRGLLVRTQVSVPLTYDEVHLQVGYRIDILVEESIVVEVKAIEALHPVHEAQVLTYLRFSEHRLGFLINFNVGLIKSGIRRLIL
ncbi:MAG: GxxExxY protein [Fimbriimonadaceae bacterium]